MKKLTEYVTGSFLKAVHVLNENESFVITNVEEVKEKDKENITVERLRLTLERNGQEYSFDLNQTNIKFLINCGYIEPRTLIGHKLFFKKALVRNPKTNTESEGLRIYKID